MIKNVKLQFNQLRCHQNNEVHGRTTEISAVLTIGFTLFTQFLYKNCVINQEKKDFLDTKATSVLNELVELQSQEVTELKPSELFYDAFEQLLATHTISVKVINNTGYYGFGSHFGDFSQQGKQVGYYDCKSQRYYLFPDAIYGEVEKFYSNGNLKKFPVNSRTLWRYMSEDGYLYQNDKKRYKVAKRINGKTEYVIDIAAREIADNEITDTIESSATHRSFPRFGEGREF